MYIQSQGREGNLPPEEGGGISLSMHVTSFFKTSTVLMAISPALDHDTVPGNIQYVLQERGEGWSDQVYYIIP